MLGLGKACCLQIQWTLWCETSVPLFPIVHLLLGCMYCCYCFGSENMNIVSSKAINNCDLLWKGTICSNCMTFKGKRPSTEMTWDVSGLLKGMCVDLYVVENSACAHLVPVSYCVQPWAEGSQLIFHWKINDEISLSFFPPSLSLAYALSFKFLS